MDEGKEIRFIDLFSGIGGFRKGLERAGGFRHVWSCDNNKYANQVYTRRFGEAHHHTGDIRGVNTEDVPNLDILCAGFPCQAFSTAGKRKGFQDTRGTLFFEICRIAKAKKPSLLLLENVKGFLNHDRGKTFTIVLQTLDELGYWVEWQVLNSKYFGVPQNRERVFIIGHLRGGSTREIFPITKGQGVSTEGGRERTSKDQLSTAITQNLKRGVHSGGETLIIDPKVEGCELRTKTGLYAVRMPLKFIKRNQKNIEGDYAFTVDGANTGGVAVPDIANTVDQDECLRFGQRVGGQVLPIAHRRIRRLTPIECERLQGFPDNWTKWGHLKGNLVEYEDVYGEKVIQLEEFDLEGEARERTIWTVINRDKLDTPLEDTVQVSNTQRYKCIGNAVTVNVIEFLGKRIREAWR